ncbi:MAG: PQQ-dependent sugar dehydrogenase [Pseudomonadales bacterium]
MVSKMISTRPLLITALAIAAATHPAAHAADPQATVASELHEFRIVTVVDALDGPWSIAFLPGGDLLVTERPGRLRIVRDGALDPEPVEGVPEVWYSGQGGLLEVAVHPAFETNRLLYLSYSKPNAAGDEATTAVARGRFDGQRLTDVEDIFVAAAWSNRGPHFGSKLAFDAAGHLFITVGDRGADPFIEPRSAHPSQDLTTHHGTLIRLHDDGRVPADNPFVGREDALPEIWSYGHRNAQGLVVDLETNEVWLTEHGPQGGDELNLAQAGRNYGWPVIGYGVQYGGRAIHEDTHRDGMEQPVLHWTPSIGASGLMLYTGDAFPQWRGQLFAGGLAGQQIARIVLAEGNEGYQIRSLERPPLLSGWARIREIRQGPDGFIYIATDDRRGGGTTPVVRLEPAG